MLTNIQIKLYDEMGHSMHDAVPDLDENLASLFRVFQDETTRNLYSTTACGQVILNNNNLFAIGSYYIDDARNLYVIAYKSVNLFNSRIEHLAKFLNRILNSNYEYYDKFVELYLPNRKHPLNNINTSKQRLGWTDQILELNEYTLSLV
jgi:hypothetical protein